MTLALKNARSAAVLIPLLFGAACTTQTPGMDDSLGFSAQQASMATKAPADLANEADDAPAASAGALPIPTESPNADSSAIAPAYVQTTAAGASAQKLTQVAFLAPDEPIVPVVGESGATPGTAGYSFPSAKSRGHAFLSREHECLARAMFFESNRSSRAGLVAVGSVVMNRLESGKWGNTVCQVVGAPKQFAPGVLSRSMDSAALPDVMEAAQAVLKGERHPKVYKEVMFFHTAGYRYPYDNMHYVVVAGGNSFYEKRRRMRGMSNTPQMAVLRAGDAGSDAPVRAVFKRPAKALAKAFAAEKPARKPTPVKPVPVTIVKAKPVPVEVAPEPIVMPIAARFAAVDTQEPAKTGRVRKPAQN